MQSDEQMSNLSNSLVLRLAADGGSLGFRVQVGYCSHSVTVG